MALLVLFLGFSLLTAPLIAQQDPPSRKPVLIRPDPDEQKVEEFVPDPALALEHLEVGTFYLRRNNLKAAEDRFREAIRNNPKLVEAYEKLITSLERQKSYQEAIRVCRDFYETFPEAPEANQFRNLERKLSTKDP